MVAKHLAYSFYDRDVSSKLQYSTITSSSALEPWVGLGLLLRFRNNIFFYGVRLLAPRPTLNLEGQAIPFCLGYLPWPVWHGRPYK